MAQVQAINSCPCSTVHVAHAHRGLGYRRVDADHTAAIFAMQEKVPQEADGVDAARPPKVREHRKRMSERPDVNRMLAQEAVPALCNKRASA